ncbi:MAG: ABC transporter ATP-binding protein [Acidimicrobiales bacterium]
MAEPAIEIEDLSHTYENEPVLRNVDLRVERGEVFGFLGHNGAGKTTTVNILTTLITPTSGSAKVCGFDVATQRREVTERIGYLPSEVRLYGHLTATENLEFFARLSGVEDPKQAAAEALEYLGCPELGPLRLSTFSTGMRQRIGIAQAIAHRPEVLFLDEPTSGLDPAGVRQLRETIQRLNADLDMTVFMNTHLLSEVAKVCTTIGVLNHGELIYKDSIAETIRRFPDEASLEDIYVCFENTVGEPA